MNIFCKLPSLLQNYTNDNILLIPTAIELYIYLKNYININNNIYKLYIDDKEYKYININSNDYFIIKNLCLKYKEYNNSYIKYNNNKLNINDEKKKLRNIIKIYYIIKYNVINNFNYNHGDKHFNIFNEKNNNNSISSNYMKYEINNNVDFIIKIQNNINNYLIENKLPNKFMEVFIKNKQKKDNLLTCILHLFYILEIINKIYNFISYGIEIIKNIKLNPDIINISNTILNKIPNDLLICDNINCIKIKDKNCGIIYNDNIQICDYIILKLQDNIWNIYFDNIKKNTNIINININNLNKNYKNINNKSHKENIKIKQNELIELINKHL